MVSIVKVPNDPIIDYDFIAFSFNGKHSYDDFGLYRVSDGDRYSIELSPVINDITAESPSADGMYFFNSFHKQKVFNINFVFDNLSETKLRELKQWFNGKEMGDLWFAEEPYKVYSAKVTSAPIIKTLCFEQNGARVYKGEGSVQFTAYWPYAHTPDYVANYVFNLDENAEFDLGQNIEARYLYVEGPSNANNELQVKFNDGTYSIKSDMNYIDLGAKKRFRIIKAAQKMTFKLYILDSEEVASNGASNATKTPICYLRDGRLISSYNNFTNKNFWSATSGLGNDSSEKCDGRNPGDVPAPFKLTVSGNRISKGTVFQVGNLAIYPVLDTFQLNWDSRTGIISGTQHNNTGAEETRAPIPFSGNSVGGIPVGGTSNLKLNGGVLDYHYWYY